MSRVLVVSPSTFGYEERITSVVVELGHEVQWHDERIGNSFLSKALTRLKLLWLFPKVKAKHLSSVISALDKIDAEILLLINPETLGGKDLQEIKEFKPNLKVIVYKWDSIKQKPIDDLTTKVADKVYSFDPEDCRKNDALTHLPLFHSHHENKMNGGSRVDCKYDFVFVGTAQWHRVKVLAKLIRTLKENNSRYYICLVSQSFLHQLMYRLAALVYGYQGELTTIPLKYDEYLSVIDDSQCVIDVEYPNQSGLTMRSIEVLFSNSAILTTNASIREYELFDIGGVFLIEKNDHQIPDSDSLSQSKVTQLFEQYSIRTWVATLLDGQGGLTWNGQRWI